MDCESDCGKDGERVRLLPSLAHDRKLSGSAMWCPTWRSGIGADIVWLAGVLNVDIKSIQGMMINVHLCALIMGI